MTPAEIRLLEKAARLNPDAVLSMKESDIIAAAQQLILEHDTTWSQDAYLWACQAVNTIDEASSQVLPFPDRAYLRDLFDVFESEQLIAIPKSRRTFISWAVAIWIAHRIRYKNNFAAYIQSETEDKSAYIIDRRIKFVEDNLSPIYRRPYKQNKTVKGAVGQMSYTQTGSFVKAIAQGEDAMRAFTPSLVFMDEIESMEAGHKSFVATLPFAEKRCQIILVSSSKGPHGVLASMARGIGFVRFQ